MCADHVRILCFSRNVNRYKHHEIIKMLDFLIDNIFIQFGGLVYEQMMGIPMGTNRAEFR